jgi:hypothetical protein
MRLLLDGTEIPWDPSRLRTLGDAVEEARARAASMGRIVHGIEVDGGEISTGAERDMAGRPAEGIVSLHVRTTTAGALLREAVDGAILLSEALRRDIRSVLASLRRNDLSGADSLYVSCVESLGTFFQLAGAVFNGVRTGAFLLPGAGAREGADLPEPPAATTEILQRLLAARREGDWLRLADLLENEISPNLEEWSAFFSAMMGKEAR